MREFPRSHLSEPQFWSNRHPPPFREKDITFARVDSEMIKVTGGKPFDILRFDEVRDGCIRPVLLKEQ
jgi:hypothetical protein